MTEYRVAIPDRSYTEPTVVHVEANRMEVHNGMVQFFKELNSHYPCAAFPLTVCVTEVPDG